MADMAAARLRSGFVDVGRLRIHHTWGGRGSPPVLMIHGLGSAGYLGWRFNLPALAGGHRVLAPDLPGFGRSDKPRTRYGVPLFTRTLLRYLDSQGLERAAVVGASMGGRVALELALRHPGRVSRLVLVNSLGLGFPRRLVHGLFALPGVGRTAFRLTGTVLERVPGATIRQLAGRLRLVENPERALDDAYLQALREIHADRGVAPAYLATVRALFLMGAHDLSRELRRLRMPVRLIWGADDPLFPVQHATRAHRLLPGSELAVMEGAGHSPQAERPDEFNRILERFLTD
jgi:pimeloyl-ACP methyl ester carboxylesterase